MLGKRCGSNPPRDVQVHYSLSAELPIAATWPNCRYCPRSSSNRSQEVRAALIAISVRRAIPRQDRNEQWMLCLGC